MRTNIDIDDELLAEAMKATGQKTKKGAIEEALRRVTRTQRLQKMLDEVRGTGWEGDLDELRGGSTIIHTK